MGSAVTPPAKLVELLARVAVNTARPIQCSYFFVQAARPIGAAVAEYVAAQASQRAHRNQGVAGKLLPAALSLTVKLPDCW